MVHQKFESLLESVAPANAIMALTQHDLYMAFSKLMENEGVAVIHIDYPKFEGRSHNHVDLLVSALTGHGMSESATLVEQHAPTLVTDNLEKALRIYQEIQRDSLAISASLYYAGLSNHAAELAIQKVLK